MSFLNSVPFRPEIGCKIMGNNESGTVGDQGYDPRCRLLCVSKREMCLSGEHAGFAAY